MKYLNKFITLVLITSVSVVCLASVSIIETNDDTIICIAKTFPMDKSGNPIEGWVILELSVDAFGSPEKIKVIESSGSEIIEKHSIKSAERQVFTNDVGKVIKRKFNYEFED